MARSASTSPRSPALLGAVALAFTLVLGALTFVALRTPADSTLGIVQKIFYFHVGSAFAMMLCLGAGSAASLVDLVRASQRADALARACIETGVLFALNVLTSGPLWARKSWGAWWTWEPRLTLTLLLLLIAVAVLALREMSPGETGRRVGAALAILAAPLAWLIHIAVQRWGGTHPQVIRGGGIQGETMRLAFWLSVCALLSLASVLVTLRFRGIRLEQRLGVLRLRLSARDLRRARLAQRGFES